MESRIARQLEFGTYAFWLVLMLLLVLGTACGPKAYPSSRPKWPTTGCSLLVDSCWAADERAEQPATNNQQPTAPTP